MDNKNGLFPDSVKFHGRQVDNEIGKFVRLTRLDDLITLSYDIEHK